MKLGACSSREVCMEGSAGTGKTVGALFKIHTLLSRYPKGRALVARKTNTALTGSAMVTYREVILKDRSDIRWFGGSREKPAAYYYPNGSEMLVNGLDKPEKIQSTEFDWVYINEATECTLNDLEFVRMRLRPRAGSPPIPYRQLIMDCNPGAPTHWLNQRMLAGVTTRLVSRHEDNPRYFDLTTNDWTPDGREYVFGILEGLTGVRYLRFRKGLWVAAEGVVYDDWEPSRHIVTQDDFHKWEYVYTDGSLNYQVLRRFFCSVDWGYANPGTIQVWAMDNDDRMVLLREIYHTRRTDDWWADRGLELMQEYPMIEAFVCDPSMPGSISKFNEKGLPAIAANNDIRSGINAVHSRLGADPTGRPRFMCFEYCLRDRDEALERAKKPTGILSEIAEYVWPISQDGSPVKEVPVKINDHAMDAMRYAVQYADGNSALRELEDDVAGLLLSYRGYQS